MAGLPSSRATAPYAARARATTVIVPVRWRPDEASLSRLLGSLVAVRPTYEGPGPEACDPPPGHRLLHHERSVGHGRAVFDRLASAVMSWRLQRAAGMVVAATSPVVEPGVVVVNAAPFGPLGTLAPCRVVRVLDEGDRRGFSYVTLPGHALQGEELFTVDLDHSGQVRFTLRSVSRPAGPARLAPPVVRAGQQVVNRRYLAAVARLAQDDQP